MWEDYKVQQYTDDKEEQWDRFVEEDCVNGTFLQTRRFLNYHPVGRFEDCSYMIFDKKGNLAAVCPACQVTENGEKVFYSHKGSTFGGILISHRYYSLEKVLDIIESIEKEAGNQRFNRMILKITPDLFCEESGDLLQYALYYRKYKVYNELNLVIDYASYKEDILSNFSQGKRTHVHNCEKQDCSLKELLDDEEIIQGHHILSENLAKYDLKPVHTGEELLNLKNNVIKNEIGFFGVYLDKKMIAFSTMFYFNKARVAHSQYISASQEYNALSPMTYMYYCMIEEMKKRGFDKLSWGITTEHLGLEINMGLTKSKEAFGSRYCLNQIYEKML
ncbi:MAG: GNAT family N-acetyltransferase [Lachnospiraceae bacterium]|nr:GNAT family N-acetyltransferase [Lachnospiraceae bacterium]